MDEALYVMAVLTSSGIALTLVTWMRSHDLDPSARVFSLMLACYPLVGALVVGELVATSRDLAVAFYILHSAVVVVILPLWFVFAVVYTGRDRWLTRPVVAGLAVATAAVVGLHLTNPVHSLTWTEYAVVESPFPYVEGTQGALYPLIGTFQGALYLSAIGLLGYHYAFEAGPKRRQTLALLVGFLPPGIVIGAWTAGVLPGPVDGANNIASAWSLAFVAWAVFRYELFDILSLARKRVFEDLRDPVIVLDDERRLLDVNEAATETFPALADADGERVDDVLPEIVDGGTFVSEFTYYAEESREFDVTVSPLTTDEGTHGYGLVVRDVTALARQIRDLEQQSEQLERFASTLSHDLRNPLNVAQGRAELARKTGDHSHLDATLAAHDRIAQIIDDVLTLAREGRTIDEPERVRLARVFEDAWASTATGDAAMVVEPDADVTVYADATRLRNVFENLIRNSIEHAAPDDGEGDGGTATDDGVGRGLTVTLGRHADGFYVEDDGPGVPPGEREQVFEYEYSTADDGTGLGLAIVDAIATAHGWSVSMTDADSDPDASGTDDVAGSSEPGSTARSAGPGARVVFSDVDVVEDPVVASPAESD